MSPDYLDGDIILMDYALQPHDGEVVPALVDGVEGTLKTYVSGKPGTSTAVRFNSVRWMHGKQSDSPASISSIRASADANG